MITAYLLPHEFDVIALKWKNLLFNNLFEDIRNTLVKWSACLDKYAQTFLCDDFITKLPTTTIQCQLECSIHSFFESAAAIKVFK